MNRCLMFPGSINAKRLIPACALVMALTAEGADVYTFENLTVNNFIDTQDGWKDHPGQGQAVASARSTS